MSHLAWNMPYVAWNDASYCRHPDGTNWERLLAMVNVSKHPRWAPLRSCPHSSPSMAKDEDHGEDGKRPEPFCAECDCYLSDEAFKGPFRYSE
jgi:hypothetical protein